MRPEKSEVRRLLSDNSKAREALGWIPHVTFKQGIQQTIAWIDEHLDTYNPEVYQR
jgi:dTDP-glucose 4,6-dehydratase